MGKIVQENMLDRNDPKWSHPGLADEYYIDGRMTVDKFCDPDRPYEKKIKSRNKTYAALEEGKPAFFEEHPEYAEHGETLDFTVPGCPEEPDTEVRVTVRRPKKLKKKMPVIFYIAGGALIYGTPYLGPIEELSYKFNCIVVAPWYRSAIDAPYPAAINDCHAAYQWMMDNAADLHVNPEKVVINGLSAGAFLDLTFAFRLKRYGYRPRGVVSLDPIFDDRNDVLSNRYVSDNWDSRQMRQMMEFYLGADREHDDKTPECLPDYATAEDCYGLCPIIIHTSESDAGRDPAMQFMSKLYEAGTYAEIHQWGGTCHATLNNSTEDNEWHIRFNTIVDGNLKDLMKYDMRRDFLLEDDASEE